jgi:TRAP-type mannitol/chloroaromatic compound transport system permease large subunit
VSYELIALFMFASMMAAAADRAARVRRHRRRGGDRRAAALGHRRRSRSRSRQSIKLMKWYPLLTLPMFIFMGYVLSESKIADDLYKMFHVWMGPVHGGLAIGTIFLMVLISAMNGLSVAGMAIGATIALPELLRRGYDKRMVTGVIQAGSSLGILVPPSVVLVLYGMIARQPVGQLWLAGVFPGLMMAGCSFSTSPSAAVQPHLGPPLPKEERDADHRRSCACCAPASCRSSSSS